MKRNILVALTIVLISAITFATVVFAVPEDPSAPSEGASSEEPSSEAASSDEPSSDESSSDEPTSDESSSDESSSDESSSDESSSDESSSDESSSDESSSDESSSDESSSDESSSDETGSDSESETVPADGIMFTEPEVFLKPEETHALTVVVSPDGAELPPLTFTADPSYVVSVDEAGNITGLMVGVATVTATDGAGLSCSVTVRVTTSDIKLSTDPNTGEKYATGFNLGMTGNDVKKEVALLYGVTEEQVVLNGLKSEEPVKTGASVAVNGVEYAVIIFGDANSDGVINDGDVQIVCDYLTGKAHLTDDQLYAADVLKNGEVTVESALFIQRHCYGRDKIEQ